MRYLSFQCNKIDEKVASAMLVRRATKQQASYVVLATEEPKGDNREVLLMRGKEGRDQIPLVLGNADSVRNIVGSVKVRTRDEQLVGVVGFASDREAQNARLRYLNGDLSLNLVTRPVAGVQVQRGERFYVDGPAVVLTRWEPLQVVLVG